MNLSQYLTEGILSKNTDLYNRLRDKSMQSILNWLKENNVEEKEEDDGREYKHPTYRHGDNRYNAYGTWICISRGKEHLWMWFSRDYELEYSEIRKPGGTRHVAESEIENTIYLFLDK